MGPDSSRRRRRFASEAPVRGMFVQRSGSKPVADAHGRREYPPTLAWRIGGAFLGLFCVGFGIAALWVVDESPVASALLAVSFVPLGILLVLVFLRDRIVVDDDAIEHI